MRPLCAPHGSRSAELSHSPKAVILRSKPGCDAREGDVQRHPPEDQRFSNTTHSRTGPPAQALSHCFANASGLASPRPRHSPNAGDLRRKIPKRSCSPFILRHQSKRLPALIGCRGPPSIHHISSDETLPKSADIVVIGGGIVGASAAYFLARRGLSVALIEKGYVGCEQSSRNWGWCRRQNREASHCFHRLKIEYTTIKCKIR